ncbi:MAG: heme lyase CcmF/NrfE family subunit [Candidatus Dormibacter sp.]|uniref:heme lyase CcmF/NrfE family subunit n=1 Tax=Candidatus Dormibacter sp. TaxID=2973982 RepID=UPI000DB58542|nr:MAG: cytochrome C biogenesis protein [Candidatus Dormibacteraeota bacterium]
MSAAILGAAFLLTALVLDLSSGVLALTAGLRGDPVLARVARRAFYAGATGVVGAAAVLLYALLSHDFSLAYVVEHTDRSLATPLVAAAFYGGQEGSLLYWALLLSLLGAASLAAAPRLGTKLPAYANAILAGLAGFFLLVLVFVSSPFDVLPIVPGDGLGLTPVLRDGGMLVHPPFLLAGYSSFAVPFSFAMAALWAGEAAAGGEWIRHTRRFALLAWALQSTGLVLGMWWAYHVLGWGGYWGWDPVENVALLPWLVTTAYLHTALVQERASGQLRTWGFGLVVTAFLLSIFGTFIVRSGVVPSVHTFAVSPLGPWFFGFFLICLAASLVTLTRAGRSAPGPQLASPAAVSREGAFHVQNGILLALAAAVLWGVLLPLLSGLTGRQLVVGQDYYERVSAPLFVLLLALLGFGPLLPWQRAGRTWLRNLRWPLAAGIFTLTLLLAAGVRQGTALLALPLAAAGLATCGLEYARGTFQARRLAASWPVAFVRLAARNRRRYGAYLAHIGFLVLVIGIAGSHAWQQQQDVQLKPGQSMTLAGHHLTYLGTREERQGDHVALIARLSAGSAIYEPSRLTYPALGDQVVSRVAIDSGALDDVYVVLTGTSAGDVVSLRVFVNPLVSWVWVGASLLVTGMVLGHLSLPLGARQNSPALRPVPARTT